MKIAHWLVTATALVTTACGSSTQPSASPNLQTLEPGKLIACSDHASEPFVFREGDTVSGIDVDLVRAIAGDLDRTAEFRDIPFDQLFDEMTEGSCDLVASVVSITEERKQKYAFSDGYFEVVPSLLVRAADAGTLTGLDAFEGRSLGVLNGTTGQEYAATRAPKATVRPFDSYDTMVAALRGNEIDGLIEDLPINLRTTQKQPDTKVTKRFTDVERGAYGFVFPKTSEPLLQAVNASLDRIREDGRYDEILKRYLGSAVS